MEVREHRRSRLVVVGHGPTGHRLVEAVRERDVADGWQITMVGEETRPAQDRVALTSYLTDDAELGYPSHDDEVILLTGDPGKLRRFVSFVNAPGTPDPSIAFEPERDQIKPVLIAGRNLEVVTS
jgi:hypothetical protein